MTYGIKFLPFQQLTKPLWNQLKDFRERDEFQSLKGATRFLGGLDDPRLVSWQNYKYSDLSLKTLTFKLSNELWRDLWQTLWCFCHSDFEWNRFCHFEAPKTAILTKLAALNFKFLETFKCEIPKNSKLKTNRIVKMAIFDLLNSSKIDFT